MDFFINLILRASVETLYLTGMIIVFGLLLGVLRNNSIKNFHKSLGMKAIMITGVIGVPIHELSHAVLSLAFRHDIRRIKLFQKPDSNGVMGYVDHSYNPNSLYQQIGNFFIGVAPIFGGVITIIALMYLAIPSTYNKFISVLFNSLHITKIGKVTIEGLINSYGMLIKSIFSAENFKNPYFYLFLILSICIASHISLSMADIKGASRGLIVMFLLLVVINAFGLSIDFMDTAILKYNILITGMLVIALILSATTFIISLILSIIKR
ncbi:hypothetical protein [Clostridium manihotivorum]|uniref:Uncharacterized protein n=1 Tax=Clostridium manihotivorum TaxID=2320868 RepID=A0A3R5UAV4_9CLOT|nr:hypothetical protein [Clostridium manihotivorum]QAA33995.1 hypothetical protein C1I91_21530 [Clostridium manihotivorum]